MKGSSEGSRGKGEVKGNTVKGRGEGERSSEGE